MSTSTDYKAIALSIENGVAVIELDNPPLNVITLEVGQDLKAACAELSENRDVRAVIFRSANRGVFSAGADVGLMSQIESGGEELLTAFKGVADVMDSIEALPMPTIAQLEGIALGGGFELALACDFRIAGDDLMQIGLPEVRLALLPGGGGTQRLPRLVGKGVATEMIMKGMRYDAETALAKGLLHHVVPADELTAHVEKYAASLAAQAPVALRHIKKLINAAFVTPETGLELERELFLELLATSDVKEGVTAATENRRAQFTGA